jgi:hypothetical protein
MVAERSTIASYRPGAPEVKAPGERRSATMPPGGRKQRPVFRDMLPPGDPARG